MFSSPDQKIEALKSVPMFKHLKSSHLNKIASSADEVKLDAGKIMTSEGEYGREFILIINGKASIEKNGEVIAERGPGEWIGEMALLDEQPRSATVKAETPIDALVISSRSFSQLLDSVPDLQRQLLITLSKRLRESDSRHSL